MADVQHYRLTPAQFSQALRDAGLSLAEFERLTGASVSTSKRWLKPDTDPNALEPPFWVTSWLALYMMPGAAQTAARCSACSCLA